MPFKSTALAAAALACLAVLAPAPPASAAPAGPAPAELDAFVADHLERTGLPGAAFAVVHGDRVVHTGAHGRDGHGRPLRTDTPLPVASLSKSMTALAVLRLVEEGALDLDDPVREHLPGFATADPRGADITVRQVLDQSSGLHDLGLPDGPEPATLAEAVDRLSGARLAAAPGREWNYHNPNYRVAARLVETVTGEPFTAYLERAVLAPAGMADTRSASDGARTAPGHFRAYGLNLPVAEPAHFATGSGDMVSTADDMARWLLLHLNGGAVPGGPRVVSPETVEEAHTPSAPNGRTGLGWMRRGPADGASRVQVWHGGTNSTHTAYQVLVPETGYGVAVLTNVGIALTEEDTWALAEGLIDLTEGRTPAPADSVLWKVDAVLGAATLAVLALGVRGVLRAPAWAAARAGRPRWRAAVRLAPYALPPLALAAFDPAVTFVMGGREGTWLQRFYGVPAELVLLVSAALVCAAVAGTRLWRLRRRPAEAVSAAPGAVPSP
ncbi:serine hydrolase domain-containing protein [Nocardiopsis sp. NPDC006139]|uniref:serine hydrolase domain-containing protein n=1 Tax=Nocardiopsis sp. NPDC006139 TaxID=3154578 RepID=UPI0033BED3DD